VSTGDLLLRIENSETYQYRHASLIRRPKMLCQISNVAQKYRTHFEAARRKLIEVFLQHSLWPKLIYIIAICRCVTVKRWHKDKHRFIPLQGILSLEKERLVGVSLNSNWEASRWRVEPETLPQNRFDIRELVDMTRGHRTVPEDSVNLMLQLLIDLWMFQ
jgi:hypothetical protein